MSNIFWGSVAGELSRRNGHKCVKTNLSYQILLANWPSEHMGYHIIFYKSSVSNLSLLFFVVHMLPHEFTGRFPLGESFLLQRVKSFKWKLKIHHIEFNWHHDNFTPPRLARSAVELARKQLNKHHNKHSHGSSKSFMSKLFWSWYQTIIISVYILGS